MSFTLSSSSTSKENSGLLQNMGHDDDGDAASTGGDRPLHVGLTAGTLVKEPV